MLAIKNCAECGCAPEMFSRDDPTGSVVPDVVGYRLRCPQCRTTSGEEVFNETFAIERWNRKQQARARFYD